MIDKPNLVIPLANSYNPRGIAGFTNAITNVIDQDKVNCIYFPVKNAMTGKVTLYLAKRPGVTDSGETFGTTGQVAYAVNFKPGYTGVTAANLWVFSVSGNDVRASDNAGTTTVILSSANFIPRWVDKTAISGADTLVVQLYNTSSAAQKVYYSTAIATFTEISDATFTGLTHVGKMEFLDGYAFVFDRATNRIYNSDLNSLSAWGDSSYITKQIKQDVPQGLAKLGDQILGFGAGSVEVFRNAGTPTGSPLVTVKALAQDIGLYPVNGAGLTSYYTTINKRLYVLARVATNQKYLAMYDGERFHDVSNGGVNKILNEQNVYAVDRMTVLGNQAVALQLTLTTDANQRWLLYFPEWNEWFEWTTTLFTPVNTNGYCLGVGSNQHKLYAISSQADNWQDAGTNYTMQVQFKLPDNGNERKFMPMCGVVADTQRSASVISVSFSDDDYQNFSTARDIDLTSSRKMLNRCGSYRQRAVRLTNSTNHECRIQNFFARIE